MADTPCAGKVSVVIPVYNDAGPLADLLARLQPCRESGHEVVVVDGGSADNSMAVAISKADRVMMAGTGRAMQMNVGAQAARHDYLLFLHADTRLPDHALESVAAALDRPGALWGRFDVRLSGAGAGFRVIAAAMNWRSRLTGVATGDQAIFVKRREFFDAGGYLEIPLMEDVALSKRLRRQKRPVCLKQKVLTSSRRWEEHGVARTVLLMWSLRLAYFLGADPQRLAARYHGRERH